MTAGQGRHRSVVKTKASIGVITSRPHDGGPRRSHSHTDSDAGLPTEVWLTMETETSHLNLGHDENSRRLVNQVEGDQTQVVLVCGYAPCRRFGNIPPLTS
jgi:hypothetical protein